MITKLFYSTLIILLLSCTKDTTNNELIETDPPVLKANIVQVNDAIGGYYSALPVHYSESNKKYPLLIFIHGGGQFGDGNADLPALLREAIPELLNEQLFPPNFKVNGVNYSFVILAPQFSQHPSNNQVWSFITYALNNYRVDSSRIYITGFSKGGEITCDVSAKYASLLAAIVPIAGVSDTGNLNDKCKSLAENNLPIWLFHNDNDSLASLEASESFISLINSFHPSIPPKFTIFKTFGLFGHDAWTRATDPNYKENGMNMYEWMLQYHR